MTQSQPIRTMLLAVAFSLVTHAAVAKDTGYLFVSSEKDNTVTVLDGSNYAVVKQIQTAARPRHLQFNHDRTLIYAACGDGNAIDVIDVASLTLVDRILAVRDPEAFDLSADGRHMYISLEDDSALAILDLETYFAARTEKPDLVVAGRNNEAEDTRDDDDDDVRHGDGAVAADVAGITLIETGPEPEGVLANPDGRTVYVASEVANIVHVIDLDSGKIVNNAVVGNRPRRLVLAAEGRELWVTNELGASVSILDTVDYRVMDTIAFLPRGMRPEDVTPVGMTLTADGKTAIVALGRANHVAFVDVASRKIEAYVLVGERAWNTTLDRDNARLFVVNGLSDDITIIDVEDRTVIKSVRVGRVPYEVLIDD